MSKSRLKKSESKGQSYLQHPIEYRKVFHQRKDHYPSLNPSSPHASDIPHTQSRL